MKKTTCENVYLKKYIIDFTKTLSLIVIGYVFVSGIWQDLYWTMIPRLPVLTNHDIGNFSTSQTSKRQTENGYLYTTDLYYVVRKGDIRNVVTIEQTTAWYIDVKDAINAWQNPMDAINESTYPVYAFSVFDMEDKNFLDDFYVVPVYDEIEVPSLLKCHDEDESFRVCIYFGRAEHWFTQIMFVSENKNILTEELMNNLIEIAIKIIFNTPQPN